jgi:hypothetical protein
VPLRDRDEERSEPDGEERRAPQVDVRPAPNWRAWDVAEDEDACDGESGRAQEEEVPPREDIEDGAADDEPERAADGEDGGEKTDAR